MMSLPSTSPETAFDPQVASGNTVKFFSYSTGKVGFELDRRMRDRSDNITRVTGNCVKAWEVLDELYPEMKFEAQTSNPPFGLTWVLPNGDKVDSTAYTWTQLMKRTPVNGYGWFMANQKTIERLGLHEHKDVYLYQRFPVGIWKNVEVEIGVVFWYKSNKKPQRQTVDHTVEDLRAILKHKGEFETGYDRVSGEANKALFRNWKFFNTSDLDDSEEASRRTDVEKAFEVIQTVIDEEVKDRPDFNIWLGKSGALQTYLSTRFQVKRGITRAEVLRLATINNQNPLTLTVDRETRKLLSDLIYAGVYSIQPQAKAAMEDALKQVEVLSTPLMPCSDFSRVAYLDESEQVLCKASIKGLPFTPGKRYEVTTGTYKFTQKFTRNKVHFDEQSRQTYTAVHDCQLSGQDRYISIIGDDGYAHRFMDRPKPDDELEHPETDLWRVFAKPNVPTVLETNGAKVEKNILALKTQEMLGSFSYFPGQLTFLGRMAVKDSGLCAAGTGCGKTLMAISLIQLKDAHRALIIAPQGTVKKSEDDEGEEEGSEKSASQWISELRQFCPGKAIFELFCYEDYLRIMRLNGGQLPPGIYVSYPECLFKNHVDQFIG